MQVRNLAQAYEITLNICSCIKLSRLASAAGASPKTRKNALYCCAGVESSHTSASSSSAALGAGAAAASAAGEAVAASAIDEKDRYSRCDAVVSAGCCSETVRKVCRAATKSGSPFLTPTRFLKHENRRRIKNGLILFCLFDDPHPPLSLSSASRAPRVAAVELIRVLLSLIYP